MKALLLRVGIDSFYGALSPVWDDMSYVYIPICNKNIKEIERGEKRTYKDLLKSNVKYLPQKLHNKIVHYDPEFETYTYGDPTTNKKLTSLKPNDLFIFYMGGIMQNSTNEKGCFIIGYFEVESVEHWKGKLTPQQKAELRRKFPNNAHAISSKTQKDLTIVKGNNNSKKLEKCIKITVPTANCTNPAYVTNPELTKSCGIRRFITRAIPIIVTEEKHLKNLKELLGIK